MDIWLSRLDLLCLAESTKANLWGGERSPLTLICLYIDNNRSHSYLRSTKTGASLTSKNPAEMVANHNAAFNNLTVSKQIAASK